jgi:hypothetical protein
VAVRYPPGLRVFSKRLRATGTAATVALTADRRTLLTILHAMGQHHTPWQPEEVLNAS